MIMVFYWQPLFHDAKRKIYQTKYCKKLYEEMWLFYMCKLNNKTINKFSSLIIQEKNSDLMLISSWHTIKNPIAMTYIATLDVPH